MAAGYDEKGASGNDAAADAEEEDGFFASFRRRPNGGKTDKADKANRTPEQRRKRRWKIVRRCLYAFVGLFFVVPALAFVITYFMVDVPSPEEVAAEQGKVVTYYYANNKELGKEIPSDGGNRTILKPEDITPTVRHAVYAAEDATFETNSGFDISGIMRAAWNQVTGGSGGGSTISQQYIKKATDEDAFSLTRKWTELVKSFKMNNEQSKDEIITAYLNTIYFGKGAYGIETAAQAYFGVHAKDLNPSQAALLAGMIQQPGRAGDQEVMDQRWNYVLDQMVANGWLAKTDRDTMEFPKLAPEKEQNTISGTDAYIMYRVKEELEAKGYPEERVQAGGYKIYTTIDPRAQKIAKESVKEAMGDQPKKLRKALVAVDPKTGGIRAYYGGPNEPGVDEIDWGKQLRNPGSSFKPFDLVALLHKGKGLGDTYDGSSPRKFGQVEVANSENEDCPEDPCSVATAMEYSVNTVFYDIVFNEVGPQAVKDAAMDAGIPEKSRGDETMANPDGNISIGGGHTVVSPADMAGAYATFANGGTRHETHIVQKLTTADGEVIFDESTPEATQGEPAFSSDPEKSKQIAGNVTMSLEPVLDHSDIICSEDDRDCAGKTGTHQYVAPDGSKSVNENAEAWMVGYTPTISAAAWVGTGKNEPIRDAEGNLVYGSGLPSDIWSEFMTRYHEGLEEEEFDDVELIGKEIVEQDDAPPPPAPTNDEPDQPTPGRPNLPSTPPTSATPPGTGEPSNPGGGDDEEEPEPPPDRPDRPDPFDPFE